MVKKDTPFRIWLTAKWVDYQDEMVQMRLSPTYITPAEYFRQYRWWLKSQYRLEKLKVYEGEQ